jgi:hypothetical protein
MVSGSIFVLPIWIRNQVLEIQFRSRRIRNTATDPDPQHCLWNIFNLRIRIQISAFWKANLKFKQCCADGAEEPKLSCLPKPKLRIAAPAPRSIIEKWLLKDVFEIVTILILVLYLQVQKDDFQDKISYQTIRSRGPGQSRNSDLRLR